MNGASFFKSEAFAPDPIATLVRRSCSECGSDRIRWAQLVDLLPSMRAELRADAHELVRFVGPDADAWLCSDCGGFGAFGPTMFDGF
jgi:hypothetical protein